MKYYISYDNCQTMAQTFTQYAIPNACWDDTILEKVTCTDTTVKFTVYGAGGCRGEVYTYTYYEDKCVDVGDYWIYFEEISCPS
mmetsp:Transcript_24904/g.38772  ORF Transcript_24904/g.38772 Transcript_24904/m.38772 type:complete len:84 (+) Transcript_24904:441-692(+)